MELKLERDEVRKILLEWAEKEMTGRFNTVTFSSFGNEVTFTFVEPTGSKEDKKENERNITNTE